MSSNFNNAKIINVYYTKGDRKPYDVNGKPIAYIGEESVGATLATKIRFYLGEDIDSSVGVIITKRPDGERRLDICAKEGSGANSYYEVELNAWYSAVKGKATLVFKAYNGDVEFDDEENPTEIISVEGRIVVSDIFNLEIAYAPEADLVVPPDNTEPYEDWFFALSTKLDKAQSITVTGALPTLTGDVYDDRYFYVENEGTGRLYYINGSTAIEVVFQVGTLKLTPTGNGDITENTGKLSWVQSNGTAELGLYNYVNVGIGEDVFYYGKANATITKGQAIQFGGYQGDHILMKPAVPAEINANPKLIMGIAKHNVANGDFGYVLAFGKLDGYDSGSFAVGSLLWFNSSSGSNGLLTATQPTAPNAKILMCSVIKAETSGAANNGVIQVRVTIEPKLEELQNVLITSVANGNVLAYDGTKWVNSTRLSTAESNIINIEDGATVVGKALGDQNGNTINTTYLTIATGASTYVPLSSKGVANGVVPLNADNKISSIYLSGEQDDFVEYANLAAFPAVGEADIIYCAIDTGIIYRWTGSTYAIISPSLALGTTAATAFAGDRGLATETKTNNIVSGTQGLTNTRITNSAVGVVPLIVNGLTSTTANLTEFQVNGAKKLEVNVNGWLYQNGTRLFTQTGATSNTFFGQNSGGTATTGTLNSAFGIGALTSLTSGSSNTAVGRNALTSVQTTGNNVAIGVNSLAVTNGSSNTAIGMESGFSLQFGTENTFIGRSAGNNASQLVTASNSTALGHGSFTDKSNQMVFGNASVTEFKFDRNASAVALLPKMQITTLGQTGVRENLINATVSDDANSRFVLNNGTIADGLFAPSVGGISNNNNLWGLSFTGFTTAGNDASNSSNFGLIDFNTVRTDSVSDPFNGTFSNVVNRRLFTFRSNTNTFMTILSNGNVGIGTTSPNQLFEVKGSGLTYAKVSSATNGSFRGVGFGIENDVTVYGSVAMEMTNGQMRFQTGFAGWGGFQTFFTNGSERMRITDTGNVGIGTTTPTATLQVKSDSTTKVPLIVDTVASHTASLQEWKINGTTQAFIDNGGYFRGAGIYNKTTYSNSILYLNDTGTIISRNVADTNPALIVNLANASATGNIQVWQKAGVAQAYISNNGYLYNTGLVNVATASNAVLDMANIGVVITRNVADTNPALIVNLANASATGNIQVWQKAGSALATITNTGGATFSGLDVAGNTTLGSNTFGINHSVTINASTGGIGNLIIRNSAATITGRGVGITFLSSSATAMGSLNVVTTDGTDLSKAGIRLSSTEIITLNTNSADRMSIANDGNITIDKLLNFAGTPSNAQTGDYTLVLADKGKVLRINSSSNRTITIPLNSSVAFPIDTEIAILRYGTGTVSISPTAGVTLNSKNSERKISGQYGSVALKKIGTNEWVLVGSLEA